MAKAVWGKSKLRFCPTTRKVWQIKYDRNKLSNKIVIHKDMPSYGLERKEIPQGYEH